MSNLSDLREVRAVVPRATLNTESILIIRIIRPRQIDLSRRHGVPTQIRGSVWKRIRRRCWRRSRCWSWCWSRRRRRSGCWCWCRRRSWCRSWSRRRITTTAGGELERTDSRAPVELTRRRVILRSKPESTIIYRIDRESCIVTPSTTRSALTSSSGKKRRLTLRQDVQGITREPACIT